MTVRELIKILRSHPPSMRVIRPARQDPHMFEELDESEHIKWAVVIRDGRGQFRYSDMADRDAESVLLIG